MIILDQIEKLINEHGSATVLRERLALAKDQFSILEKEIVNLRSENAVLTSKVETLQAENQSLKKDNEELRRKIKEYEQVANQLPRGPRTKRGDFM
jgi:septal ring factor EnvC (AmiA/AmiB activator)